jgi:hypothetical protein
MIFIALLVAVTLSSCTQAPPTPAEKQAAQEQAKKQGKGGDIRLKETGW